MDLVASPFSSSQIKHTVPSALTRLSLALQVIFLVVPHFAKTIWPTSSSSSRSSPSGIQGVLKLRNVFRFRAAVTRSSLDPWSEITVRQLSVYCLLSVAPVEITVACCCLLALSCLGVRATRCVVAQGVPVERGAADWEVTGSHTHAWNGRPNG
jgi:hypothetical protein